MQEKFEGNLKIKLCSKGLYPIESVKYLGVKIDTNLSWPYHVNDLSIKLNRANALFSKWKSILVLKYWDQSILLFLTPTDPNSVLSGPRIVFNEF